MLSHIRGTRTAYQILIGKIGGENPLRRARRRHENEIEQNLKGTGWEDVDWIRLAQDRD
jgi:hypothetical protein